MLLPAPGALTTSSEHQQPHLQPPTDNTSGNGQAVYPVCDTELSDKSGAKRGLDGGVKSDHAERQSIKTGCPVVEPAANQDWHR